LAAVFESIHIASLIHDDIIDKCQLRRDMPTMNEVHGTGSALLLGDMVFAKIFMFVAQTNKMWLVENAAQTINTLVEGELLQQHYKCDLDVNFDNYIEVIGKKTAELLKFCAFATTKFFSDDQVLQGHAKEFGYQFGLIFQMVDDWADFYKSAKDDHKNRGVDISNGFITLPWLFLLQNANEQEHSELKKLILSGDPSGLSNTFIKNLAGKYNLFEQIKTAIYNCYGNVQTHLAGMANSIKVEELQEIVDFVIISFEKMNK
jgi:geranylgeranyl pyrophosphate synthase